MKRYGNPWASGRIVGLRFSKTGGWRRILQWDGPNAQLEVMLTGIKSLALDFDYRPGLAGADGTLTATYGTPDDVTPTDSVVESIWELDEAEAYDTLWGHPLVQAIFAGRTVDDLAVARGAIERYVANGTTDEPYSSMITTLRASSTDFDEFLKRLSKTNNNATYYIPTVIIRHTLTGPIAWRYQFDWDSVACQISTATLVKNEPTIPFTVPPSRYWLTRLPTLRQLPNGKLQVTREWQESEHDTWIYTQL